MRNSSVLLLFTLIILMFTSCIFETSDNAPTFNPPYDRDGIGCRNNTTDAEIQNIAQQKGLKLFSRGRSANNGIIGCYFSWSTGIQSCSYEFDNTRDIQRQTFTRTYSIQSGANFNSDPFTSNFQLYLKNGQFYSDSLGYYWVSSNYICFESEKL